MTQLNTAEGVAIYWIRLEQEQATLTSCIYQQYYTPGIQ